MSPERESDTSDSDSESESDDNNENDDCDRFLCEFCSSEAEYFQTKEELMSHTLKSHPTVCLGCFELFIGSENFLQHLNLTDHEPPLCRACCCVFSDLDAKVSHSCSSTVSVEASKPVKTEDIKEECEEFPDIEPFSEDEYEAEDDLVTSPSSGDEDNGTKKRSLRCFHCSTVFRTSRSFKDTKRLLRNHTLACHPTVCCNCFEAFDDADALTQHQDAMDHQTWSCKPCSSVYLTEMNYQFHLSGYHIEQCPVKCTECVDFGTFTEHQLQRHMLRFHDCITREMKTYLGLPLSICPICHYQCSSSFGVIMHMFKSHPKAHLTHAFKCEECKLGFSWPSVYGFHLHQKHANDEQYQKLFDEFREQHMMVYECEPCCRTFETHNTLLAHLRVSHLESMPHRCSTCNAGYLDPYDLLLHQHEIHNGPSPYVCMTCDQVFDQMVPLLRHVNRYHDLTAIPYVYCFEHKSGFYTFVEFTRHFRNIHESTKDKRPSNIEPKVTFACELCDKVYKIKHHFIDHMAVHNGLEFSCKICDKTFTTRGGLYMHEKTHTNKFKCEQCGRNFCSRSFLIRHAVVHSGERPFQCQICGLRVSQNSALLRHMNKVHPGGIAGIVRVKKPRRGRLLLKEAESSKDEETIASKPRKRRSATKQDDGAKGEETIASISNWLVKEKPSDPPQASSTTPQATEEVSSKSKPSAKRKVKLHPEPRRNPSRKRKCKSLVVYRQPSAKRRRRRKESSDEDFECDSDDSSDDGDGDDDDDDDDLFDPVNDAACPSSQGGRRRSTRLRN